MSAPQQASIVVCSSKDTVPKNLNDRIVQLAKDAIAQKKRFTIALSGGSLASFLSTLRESCNGIDNQDQFFQSWHVILADERCVPEDDNDSNLGILKAEFLSQVPIPESQIYGINQTLLQQSASAHELAQDYETNVIRKVLQNGSTLQLDLAVLGFGPDGHTCSLFPDHTLLQEQTKLVAGIQDSPKPPPQRITLTFPVLNEYTKHVIFCGAGSSKGPILEKVFDSITNSDMGESSALYQATLSTPPPYPCAMVQPTANDTSVAWIVDKDAWSFYDSKE